MDNSNSTVPPAKSRKPANTAFKQQRLKAWQPLLTPRTVLPTLFIIGIVFAPLGGFLLYTSDTVAELVIDYTNCISQAPEADFVTPANIIEAYSGPTPSNAAVATQWRKYSNVNVTLTELTSQSNPVVLQASICSLKFMIPVDFKRSVFMYYKLTNFYQNHRRYVKSYDAPQLKGKIGTPDKNCAPLDQKDGKHYYPCGLIANSVFNDTISNLKLDSGTEYSFFGKGVAWPSDKEKFVRPTITDVSQLIPPPSWADRFPGKIYNRPEDLPDLRGNERFQVWMRTAALPNFRKLYGRNDEDDLKAGIYTLNITDFYNVSTFGGTKSVVISTVSFLGGKNPFLGIAYMVVGSLCVLLGVLFTARHIYKPRKLGDHSYLSWNQNTQSNNN